MFAVRCNYESVSATLKLINIIGMESRWLDGWMVERFLHTNRAPAPSNVSCPTQQTVYH